VLYDDQDGGGGLVREAECPEASSRVGIRQ
jgi:hypothetical protein